MTSARSTNRESLISSLRERHAARQSQSVDGTVHQLGAGPTAYDFGVLPELQTYRLMASAAEYLGLQSPYFRCHEGGVGARHVIDGEPRVNFGSYDYLSLNGHPKIASAVAKTVSSFGVSPSASRLVGGERPCHRNLERALAELHGVDDAVAMVSGHATNVTAIATLLGPEDLIIADALAHNSIVEGAKLSGAVRISFPHNDYDWLATHLSQVRSKYRRVLIAVEGLYSMDGDSPDLRRLIEIKSDHDAWLMVDEAHSIGVLGASGRGLAEAQGVDATLVEIWMGTLSKTLASCGGYIAGSNALIELLKCRAPGFVFSVGLAPVLAVAAEMALEIMLSEPARIARLSENGRFFQGQLRDLGLDTGLAEGHAIVPVITGDSLAAVALSHELFDRGINVLPVVHPAVPERAARLRFFINEGHSHDDLKTAAREVSEGMSKVLESLPQMHAKIADMAGQGQLSVSIRALKP